ncbi:MAG: aldehyde dehydrogenase (NADP(+)) [bacterium]
MIRAAENEAMQTIHQIMERSWAAWQDFRMRPLSDRARLMREIAAGLEALGDGIIEIAMRETNLPEARLKGERARTAFQLRSYADACERGDWLELRIDTADLQRIPPKADIRKMMVPMGPVLVYGASNFPFAYSTAGGDTACALAAGCTVVVKAHPAHPDTSDAVAACIRKALTACGFPEDIFLHVHTQSLEEGRALVIHPRTRAVGFTGSHLAGRSIFNWANERKDPIPVFAEMGSVNPIFLLPERLSEDASGIAGICAGSITLGVGQFCTNPGLIIGVEGPGLDQFMDALSDGIRVIPAAPMLHAGISKAYASKKTAALDQNDVQVLATGLSGTEDLHGTATIATVDGDAFLANPLLHEEVFGPYSLVVRCRDAEQMLRIAEGLEGQLTCTVMGTNDEIAHHPALMAAIADRCGRLILNGVPTGVEVCLSMHHGGPYPSSTDARFTSVGADGIRRFTRPLSYQQWPDTLLPDALKNANPFGYLRIVNNEPSTGPVIA